MSPSLRRQILLAARDLVDGTRNWRIWYVLGISEVKQRYRRSTLGPFWVTLSMAIQIIVMGFVLSFLFKLPLERFLPFLCISVVTWAFLSGVVNEGANAFILMSSAILQVKRPLWTYLMLTLWRNAIVYAHTIVVFVVAAISFNVVPGAAYLLIPAGIALLIANVAWMGLAAAVLSARFRDFPLLIQNAFSVLIWLTPVYYDPEQLGPRARMIIELNPLTSVLEVARAPFLNQTPALTAWVVAAVLAVFGWLLCFGLFVRCRARVPFWL